MHNRLSQILGAGLAPFVAHDDDLCGPVVVHDVRVINRDVARTVLKVAHRVATLDHQFTNQLVCLHDNTLGVVDKAGLQSLPGTGKPAGLGGLQRHDLQGPNALFTILEVRFGLCPVLEF